MLVRWLVRFERSANLVLTVGLCGGPVTANRSPVEEGADEPTAPCRPGPRLGVRTYPHVIQCPRVQLFDVELLDDDEPFEIDRQAAHLFKHPHLGIDDVNDVWRSDPLFYPAKPPAHWLMVAEIAGRVLVVPLAPPDSGDASKCRPIGCYVAADHLAARYREDR